MPFAAGPNGQPVPKSIIPLASFYFNGELEKPKAKQDTTIVKEEQVDTLIKDKLITKLDIDQALFTLLN